MLNNPKKSEDVKLDKEQRLDNALVMLGLCESRNRAAALIKDGMVLVDGKIQKKTARKVFKNEIKVIENHKYVSRAGLKLEAAIIAFNIDVSNKVCLDIGASTGGFTQCLLEYGAEYVYALDVGKNQLHISLQQNELVCEMSGINARNIERRMFERDIEIITMDVSFISQSLLYDIVSKILVDGGVFISLIKPQFELGAENLGKGGIVREKDGIYEELFERLAADAENFGLNLSGTIDSPIRGGSGNKEFLAIFRK